MIRRLHHFLVEFPKRVVYVITFGLVIPVYLSTCGIAFVCDHKHWED
jgi:hypothetical protein